MPYLIVLFIAFKCYKETALLIYVLAPKSVFFHLEKEDSISFLLRFISLLTWAVADKTLSKKEFLLIR